MKILIDTCTFLWLTSDAPELSENARQIFLNKNNQCFLSAASAWEISIKFSLSKLEIPEPPEDFIPSRRKLLGIDPLPIDETACAAIFKLPQLHKDPFDRILVSQAIYNGLTILTNDPLIKNYPCATVW